MSDRLYGYQNATYDSIAKKFLSKKIILAYILRRVVPEFHGHSIEEIISCIES